MTTHRHDPLREGRIAGVLRAAAVAVWFLITDLIQGRPLSTPSVLGQVILYRRTIPAVTPVEVGPALALLSMGYYLAGRHRSLGRRFAAEALGT